MASYGPSGVYGSDHSTLSKLQEQYWSTKQAVFRKFGKKEDDCVVSSDLQLDAKLELLQSVQASSIALQRIVEHYQDRLIALSHEENALGHFLREHGKADQTRAGKMMLAVGKAMCYSSQQRLAVRVPLARLHQEVETFRRRAVADTLVNVDMMETSRNDYRGALLWMKDVSQELDPDTYKQMEKFRKVQAHVRKNKVRFDKLKVDCLQKIDLLAVSRCNMYSHTLTTYQNALLHFWDQTGHALNIIAEGFKGYQHYEFNMLKELTEVGKKLSEATGTAEGGPATDEDSDPSLHKDRLLFFDEYHDDEQDPRKTVPEKGDEKKLRKGRDGSDMLLFDLGEEKMRKESGRNSSSAAGKPEASVADLLSEDRSFLDGDSMALLEEIFGDALPEPLASNSGSTRPIAPASRQWEQLFDIGLSDFEKGPSSSNPAGPPQFLPSQLLDLNLSNGKAPSNSAASPNKQPPPKANACKDKPKGSLKKSQQKDMSAWFNLFADLDPLANPDAIGSRSGDKDEDRTC